MADDTLYTLADIKDYYRGCRDNATGTARKRFEKYIEAMESAMKRMQDHDRVKVCRCENCVDWEAPPENEQMDGNTTGFCRAKYGACYGQETDATWFCSDGERVEE